MKRSSLFVCCGITLLYLSDRLDSRTVSPIVYLTTAMPNVADPTAYYDGGVGGQSSGYYDGGVGGQSSGYYGGGAGGQSGYYGGVGGQSGYNGGVGGQSRNYGGVGSTGRYGGRSPNTAAATKYGSYGHRTMPESAVREAIRPVRDERSYYESPSTYEYMTNPPRKSGKVSRVPETERLPPEDDVEFIDDGGGGGANRRPAKDRRREGDEDERAQDVDDRPRGHLQNNNNNSKRMNRDKPKAKGGRKLPTREDDYTDDGSRGGDAEPVGSSTKGDVHERASAKKPHRDGHEEVGRKNKNRAPSEDGPIKHKIHKKNEYSKRQQFFDEEHVDLGKKKPKNKANHNGRKRNGHELPKQNKKKKRQQQQQQPTQKPVKRTTQREKKDDRGASRVGSQGYGQVVAVR
ncbi:ABC transporter F family member 4-like [Myzus persicae]|uniref:ABC transporter F family member 4-like n=1 Tax=Myzus persicae TaxID=13164 RepID=UPI000B9375F1|nr:ABC transporter F family member 4-like [Myzus persicae]